MRIAQESIFSGLNNLVVNSVLDNAYSNFFGFTYSEVYEMLEYYNMTDKEKELKEWYDGYIFGNEEIYNPWSVISYIAKGCIPQAYWVNTGKNEIFVIFKCSREKITHKSNDFFVEISGISLLNRGIIFVDDNDRGLSVVFGKHSG